MEQTEQNSIFFIDTTLKTKHLAKIIKIPLISVHKSNIKHRHKIEGFLYLDTALFLQMES